MEINYPYKMTISNKAEAVDAIMHMCDNCDNFFCVLAQCLSNATK